MFGSNDEQNAQNDASVMPQSSSDNGTFGMPGSPAPASPAANDLVGAPLVASDDSAAMPAADEMAASSAPSASRDTQAQTPDDLMAIKQDALQSLKPLVGHLDQTPEERFRMTMMMIQATDDQSLIPDANEAAKAIEDEKTRAQALLDVVNEINYFSQNAK